MDRARIGPNAILQMIAALDAALEGTAAEGQIVVEFPDGDATIAAELGGPGFAPDAASGWQTNDGALLQEFMHNQQ